ncbi:ankycorbin isoform X2 [Nasonia vitripennis]|uniref:Ankycorbin n=1 Tax=Nasonia vitripennis TaxID=7425 RepID=A0A7M7QCE6_NASVI|nr:ankycorbin isoform X2 [Nasonia vitripennis]
MDTRAPPIASRTQERCQQHQQQQQQQQQQQKKEEVTLPPLTSYPVQQRHKTKFAPTPSNWRNSAGQNPGLLRQQEVQRRRPYKVLGIGATPLMHACQQADRSRVLKLLREQEETIGYRDRALRSALHYCMDAATGGAVAQAAPELVDAPDAEGHTALHLAVIAGDHQLVAVLLANGADVNAKDLEGHSVLHWATVCGEVECVRLVLAAGARPSTADLRGGSPLHYAAQCCGAAATAAAELAIPKKVGLKVLQTLLEFGADVNARDEDGRQPILWAASAGSVEAVLALVRAGGSAVAGASDTDGLTALHCAASRGHARCIEALVNLCDAQPDHVDDNGCSALHYAATLGHADATSLLLKLGADPNRQDRKGRTPGLCAAAKGQLETLKILAQHGGSLHARTVRGTGVAHEAVASGRLELVKWLAKRRPSLLDVATQDGKTPLHVAALHGHLDACKLLLDSGARINALLRTNKGALMTALDAALYRGHRDCAKLIQLHGGTTAQHIRSQKNGPSKVFSTKLRMKHTETSSDSELNDISPRRRQQHRHHRDPDLYYEERWIERRTRRRANRRRLSRQDSRSFSEEELRHSKSSSRGPKGTDRHRRALSENARYDETNNKASDVEAEEEEEDDGRGSRRRRRSEKQSSKRRKEAAASAGENRRESEESEEQRSRSADEETSSVSDDSLEVVVVRRSLEKKSKKIVSGRSSKSVSKKLTKKEQLKEEKSSTKKAMEKKQASFDGDSTSQDTVEQVTVQADVHKNEAPSEKPAELKEDEQQIKSKMDDILEKADELQNALLSKAADLRKDMEEMRQQMSQKSEEKKEDEVTKEEDMEKKSSEDDKPAADSSKSEMDGKSMESTSNEASSAKDTPRDEADQQQSTAEVAKEEKCSEELAGSKVEEDKVQEKADEAANEAVKDTANKELTSQEASAEKRESIAKDAEQAVSRSKEQEQRDDDAKSAAASPRKDNVAETREAEEQTQIPGTESFRYADENSSGSPPSGQPQAARRGSRPSTGKRSKSKTALLESSEERSPDRSAIVAVIESPEWDEEDDEELDKEIRQVVGDTEEHEDEDDEEDGSDGIGGADDETGIVRVLPSTSEEEMAARASAVDSLPQLQTKSHVRMGQLPSPRHHLRQRRDSGGRDSGIEPSPRVSRIPRRTIKCCPNSERQQALHMDTITRDVQISLRRYHLERKIFFQLMELKRLQIRHGRANENVLVKRQVESFHKAGMSGPALGVARYDQPYTFRHFETFLYEQLRRLQRRPTTPDWCTEAKQCTQKTHRCHHATSAYTSVPIYTYLGGGGQERPSLLPRIEGRGKGQMTVEVTHGEEKQVIALPSEKLDRTKRYYVTFTVRGDTTDSDKPKTSSSSATQRNAKSV